MFLTPVVTIDFVVANTLVSRCCADSNGILAELGHRWLNIVVRFQIIADNTSQLMHIFEIRGENRRAVDDIMVIAKYWRTNTTGSNLV